MKAISRGQYPPICSFRGQEPIVCCPGNDGTSNPSQNVFTSTLTSQKRMSEIKCEEYSKIEVPAFVSISGGVAALPYHYPHMSAIGFGEQNNIKWLCGGSLISERFVLTAAHCINSRDLGVAKFVRVGDLNLVKTTDAAKPQDFTIEQIIPHPNYNPPESYHDIALFKLNKDVIFDGIKPACLYIYNNLTEDAIATGWGATSFEDVTSDDLMKVTLNIFSQENCSRSFPRNNNRFLPNGIAENIQFCAGGKSGVEDTCQGDSGGPLQTYKYTTFSANYVLGVTSFGKPCGIGKTPGVYTRVSSYIPWIEAIVWNT